MVKYKILNRTSHLLEKIQLSSAIEIVEQHGDLDHYPIIESENVLTQTQLDKIRQIFPLCEIERIDQK